MTDPASIAGPFMYPFASGATGRYFPWLWDSGGRPNTGDGSPSKGRERRYQPYQSVYFPERPHRRYLSGSVWSRSQPFTNRFSYWPAQRETIYLDWAGRFMFGGAAFGECRFFRSGTRSGTNAQSGTPRFCIGGVVRNRPVHDDPPISGVNWAGHLEGDGAPLREAVSAAYR
jgi:hypothetical protein